MQSRNFRDRLALTCLLGLSVWLSDSASSRAAEVPGAKIDERADRRFPTSNFVIDVTKPPYGAKGDGKTDDTAAIQKAILDAMGLHKVIYLPNGTYLISDTLEWTNKNAKGGNAYGFNWVQGQNTGGVLSRLTGWEGEPFP